MLTLTFGDATDTAPLTEAESAFGALAPGEQLPVLVHILDPRNRRPPASTFARLGRFFAAHDAHIAAAAFVVDAEGFVGRAIRATLEAMFRLSPAGPPRRVFHRLPDAREWLVETAKRAA